MNLIKCKFLLVSVVIPISHRVSLATIGVCVFSAVYFGSRTFYFMEAFMKSRFLTFVLTLASMVFCVIGLSACGAPDIDDYTPQAPAVCSHEYISQVINPTCVLQGYTTHTCSKCSKSYTDNYKNPIGHSYVERNQNYQCSTCEKYEDSGFTFQLITVSMAQYNEAYKNRVNTYEITAVSSTALEDGILNIPRKHLGYSVSGLYKGCLYNVRDKIKQLNIDSNISYIGSSLFTYEGQYVLTNTTFTLEKIVFSNSCKNICVSHSAFSFCKKVTDISFPNKCFGSFNHDDNIGNHFLFEDTAYYKSNASIIDGVYYLKDMALSSDSSKLSANVIIKEGTYLIANQIFAENTNIKSVTIPTSVSYIGKKAFYKNLSLASLIYNGTQSQFEEIKIESNAFDLCGNITHTYEK